MTFGISVRQMTQFSRKWLPLALLALCAHSSLALGGLSATSVYGSALCEGTLAAQLQRVGRRQPPEHFVSVWDYLAHSMSAGDLAERIQHTHLPAVEKELARELASDLFYHGDNSRPDQHVYPYTLLAVDELVAILRRGILNFARSQSTSPGYPWHDEHYDRVGYRIVHPDESISYIIAYREGDQVQTSRDRKSDLRPVINLLYVAKDAQHLSKFIVRRARNPISKVTQVLRDEADEQAASLLQF
jgi:hypothetical protein